MTGLVSAPQRRDCSPTILARHDDRSVGGSSASNRSVLVLGLLLRLVVLLLLLLLVMVVAVELRCRGRTSPLIDKSGIHGNTIPIRRGRHRKLCCLAHPVIVRRTPIAPFCPPSTIAPTSTRTGSRSNLIRSDIGGPDRGVNRGQGPIRRTFEIRRARLIPGLQIESAGIAYCLAIRCASPERCTCCAAITVSP